MAWQQTTNETDGKQEAGRLPGRQESLTHRAVEKAGRMEVWLRSHVDALALVIVALGLAARLVVAGTTYLNPDEALDYALVNQPSSLAAYRAGLTNAHPPLIYFLLYFWRFLGRSELFLRLPFLLAGSAMPWVAYKWLKEVSGDAAGVIALLLLTLSPTMIVVSAEVRPYAPLLLFLTSAVYFLERAFAEKSPGWMRLFGLALYLAILTHYSALWLVLALGSYALLIIVRRRPPARVVAAWAACQAGAAALYAFLYVTHISKIQHSTMTQQAIGGWLGQEYFEPGKSHLLLFVVGQTAEFFQYLFAQDQVGFAMCLFFTLAVMLLMTKRVEAEANKPSSRELAALLVLPFVIGCAAAVARLYPYGGTRHSSYLAPCAMAGVGLAFSRLARQRLWPALVAAMALLLVCNLNATPTEFISPRNQARVLMTEARQYIRQSVPPGSPIFVEYQSGLMLRYYLCPDQMLPIEEHQRPILEYRCAAYRLVSTGRDTWQLTEQNFLPQFSLMVERSGLKPGDTVWMVHAGWNYRSAGHEAKLRVELARQFPEVMRLPCRDFGDNIAVFELPVGTYP